MPNYRSIVAAVDFSPCSAVALAEAMRISQWSGAALHVVHVIDTLVVIEIEEALTDMQKGIREGLVADAETAWRTFAATVPGAAGLPIEVAINNRIVGIQSRARVDKADLIVLGAYGDRSPDLGVGSVATACVRKSACDVLLVRETR
ncbi:MAG: universal stress protein, partial [Planctomycetota bacterium]